MRQDGDLDRKGTIRIIVTVLVGVAVFLIWVPDDDATVLDLIAVALLLFVVLVPFLVVAHMRDERLRREREAIRRQCEYVRAKGGQCDWSKAKGGKLRYHEPCLDHSVRKPYHTGKIKEARKPPSADGT